MAAPGRRRAVLPAPAAGERLVIATDAHVVSPLFFPGGDIGCLAVHGTINDVAMMGARPLYLAASFILEEGFPWPTSPASSPAWPPPRRRRACRW
jgi:hydrogenase expression/formation protein HypE